jgi:DNA end-binding protein Ku
MASSVWRGRITFGLVTIPVRLVKAARRERTRFRRVQRVSAAAPQTDDDYDTPEPSPPPARVLEFRSSGQGAPPPPPEVADDEDAAEEAVVRVRNTQVSGLTDKPVQPSQVLKGYEVSKDEFVVLAPEEVQALRPRTSTELEITEFVRVEEIDPVYYDVSYYVVPESGGEKAYALLHAALRETGHAGVAALTMHGRENVVLIRAGKSALVLHTMFYANEVGRADYAGGEETKPKEVELAKMLVGALEAKFEPEKWKDQYEERLKALIESRTPVAAAGAPDRTERAPAPVADIMEALKKSLAMARKPVASEQEPAKAKRPSAKRK